MNKNNIKKCSNFKPLNDSIHLYKSITAPCCKYCAYFSSKNCGMDIADSIDTDLFFI